MIGIGLLGPLEVHADGIAVGAGGRRQRAVLAYLAVRAGTVVPDEELAEDIWDGSPPRTAAATLRVYVSRLRKVLLGRTAPDDRILTSRPGGYLLDDDRCEIDARTFERDLDAAVAALQAGDLARAARLGSDALGHWRGPALLDFRYERFAQTEIARLEERRLEAVEVRIEAELRRGRFREVTAELQSLTAAHPMREALWAQLMWALYGSGRQGEALAAAQQLRHTLADELGLDPGPDVVRLERRILAQDPELVLPADPRPVAVSAGTPSDAHPLDQPPRAGQPGDQPGDQPDEPPRAGPRPRHPGVLAPARMRAPLLERDGEVARAELAWHRARSGCPQTLLVAGVAGIGKTRLLAEVVARAGTTATTVRVARAERRADRPYALLLDAFPELRDKIRPGGGGAPDRESVADAVLAILDALDRRGPVLVVLDDVHGADRATWSVLGHVLPRLRTRALAVVAARCDHAGHIVADGLDALQAAPTTTVARLAPLSAAAASELLDHLGDSPFGALAPHAARRPLIEAASGIPLLLEELSAASVGSADTPGGADAAGHTWSILATRFDQAGPAGRAVAQLVAALGDECDLELLAEVARSVGCDPIVDGLLAVGVLEGTDDTPRRLRFTHALLAESALRSMSAPAAQAAHLAAARAMATRAERAPHRWAAAVAGHYRAALPTVAVAEALPAFERAGAVAREVGAHDQSRVWFEEAIRLRSSCDAVDRPDAGLWLRLGAACSDAGDFAAARQAYLEAAGRADGDPAVLTEAALGVAGPWQSVEEVDPVFQRLAEAAAAGLPEGASPSRARLLARLALARSTAGDRDAHVVAAGAVDEARRSGDPEAIIGALHALHMSGAVTLDRFRRLELADEMVRLGVRSGLDPLAQVGRAHRVTALLEDGRVGEATVCVRSYDREVRRRGSAMARWWSSLIRSTLAFFLGDVPGAEAAAAAALEIGTALNPADAMAIYGAQVFAMRLAEGRLPELRPALEAASGTHPDVPGWRAAYALSCVLDGDEAIAGRHLSGLLANEDGLADRYRTSTLCLLARIAVALDEPAACRRLDELLTPLSGSFAVIGTGYTTTGPVDRYLGPLARCLGQPDRAATLLRRGREAALGVGNLLWAAEIESEQRSVVGVV